MDYDYGGSGSGQGGVGDLVMVNKESDELFHTVSPEDLPAGDGMTMVQVCMCVCMYVCMYVCM